MTDDEAKVRWSAGKVRFLTIFDPAHIYCSHLRFGSHGWLASSFARAWIWVMPTNDFSAIHRSNIPPCCLLSEQKWTLVCVFFTVKWPHPDEKNKRKKVIWLWDRRGLPWANPHRQNLQKSTQSVAKITVLSGIESGIQCERVFSAEFQPISVNKFAWNVTRFLPEYIDQI
jgi:hypothetical protein